MIAFGASIITPEIYEQRCKAGIDLAAEPDSHVLSIVASGSVARSYNAMLDAASRIDGLDAMVLLHEDVEIVDPGFCKKLRGAFEDPDVAVVGCVGVTGGRDIAWWDGSVLWNSAPYRYGELGRGQLLWAPDAEGGSRSPGEAESVYGVVLALSPWVVQELRFDESIGMLHGYDFDICRQARIAGRKVMAVDLRVAHHHSLELVGEVEVWIAAHMRAAELWDPDGAGDDPCDDRWKARARRAEAEAAAARLLAASRLLQADARAQQQAKEITEIEESRSWRITRPLREGNLLLRRARGVLSRS